MAYPHSDPNTREKANLWLTDAKTVLYEEALGARLLSPALSLLSAPLHIEEIVPIQKLNRVVEYLGNDVLAELQVRRETFRDITGEEIILEQVAVLSLFDSLTGVPPLPVDASNRPTEGWRS